MSQPTEGPQPQRTWSETLDWLSEQPKGSLENLGALAALQKDEFNRLIEYAHKVPLKDKVHEKVSNATTRVQVLYIRESMRLNEMAEQLQTQAGQYLNAGREWADRQIQAGKEWSGRQIDRASAFTDRQIDHAKEFGQQAAGTYRANVEAAGRGLRAGREWSGQQIDRASAFTDRQIDRASAFTDRQIDRASAFTDRQVNRASAFTDRQVNRATEFGGRALDAGRDLRARAGRWLEVQKGRVTRASEGARATVAMAKFDKNMPGVTTRDLTELSQQHSRIMTGATLDDRLAAAQQVANRLQAQKDAQTAAQALGGLAPAGQAVNQAQGTQTQTTEQAATTLVKNNDNKGIGKG